MNVSVKYNFWFTVTSVGCRRK